MADILSRILDSKRIEVAQLRRRRGFRAALESSQPAIIAEIKQKSPSKGRLTSDFNPTQIALHYQAGGAAAISVLTDGEFFGGSLDDLRQVRDAVSLPILRKDFIIDPIQIAESAAAGADAILLIAAVLDRHELRRFREMAETFGLDVLVETHNRSELATAVDSGATIIGVNNRDLATFHESIETSIELADLLPPGVLKVSESAIRTREDIERLSTAGYQAFLIGEQLMREPTALAELVA